MAPLPKKHRVHVCRLDKSSKREESERNCRNLRGALSFLICLEISMSGNSPKNSSKNASKNLPMSRIG
ncbi:hypothetical protein HBI72_077570 [Parastagonospora nodorum]|nr:hypothetical protein HBI72_077570 [Parastagonospora nodorum]